MKYRLLFVLTNIATLFWTNSKAAIAATDKLLASIELSLQAYQQQRLNMDMPATSITFDHQHSLWIAGKKSVWKWNFTNKKLKEINLIKSENPKPEQILRQIATWDDGLVVASHQKFFKINFKPLKVLEFQTKNQDNIAQRSYGFHVTKNRIFWIKSNNVWTIDQKNLLLTPWKQHPKLKKSDQVLLDTENFKLWIIRKNKLLAHNYLAKGQATKKILEIKYRFTGIDRTESGIVLHTRHTVLVLNGDGSIKKTIPVESKRKLVLSSFLEGQHSYLFHDRFLEIHRVENLESFYSKVQLGRVKRAGKMIAKKNIIGLILDGKPRIFQIEGQW